MSKISEIKKAIAKDGLGYVVVDDLLESDLANIGWSGSKSHIENVKTQLARRDNGEVDYLCLRTPDGFVVSKGAVDYNTRESAGMIIQLATHPELRGLGLGSYLVNALEKHIRNHGLKTAIIGVEADDQPVKNLYQKLGYKYKETIVDSWQETDETGKEFTYTTDVELLYKDL